MHLASVNDHATTGQTNSGVLIEFPVTDLTEPEHDTPQVACEPATATEEPSGSKHTESGSAKSHDGDDYFDYPGTECASQLELYSVFMNIVVCRSTITTSRSWCCCNPFAEE